MSKPKEWSQYQLAVFENIASGAGHTVVNAVAGSGKTTTIVEAMKHVPRGRRTLFVAFNKSIADNLKTKAPPGVEVSTLHSYGLKTITKCLGRHRIDEHRVDGFARELYGNLWELRRALCKTVSLAKGTLAGDPEQLDELIDAFGIEIPKPKEDFKPETVQEKRAEAAMENREEFIKHVLEILLRCAQLEDGSIDFDDMVWLPVILDLNQTKFDRIFVDETQDLNAAQIEMVMRGIRPDGRICAVGDPRQAIYGFRGADSGAVDKIVDRLQATVLPLSVCYRCGSDIISEAQTIVPWIEAAPGSGPGEVTNVFEEDMVRDVAPGDFILSRTNAPLIRFCMLFLQQGRRANIQGRDVGAALKAFVKKSNAPDIPMLRNYVEGWRDAECKRLAEKHRDTSAVEDRANCVLALSDGAPSVADVIGRIETLFEDKSDQKQIILSTTHKAKGLERDRVWLLKWTYMRRPHVEENNLYYVAVTRAKQSLFLVHRDEK